MKIIKRLISPILSSLLGLLILNFFNIFDYINIAPDDLKNELALSLYILVLQIFFQYIDEFLSNTIYTTIILENYIDNNIVKNPVFILSKDNISVKQISFNLKINGFIKILKGNSIKIIFPDWIQVQVLQGKSNIKSANNELVITFDSIIPHNRKNNIAYEEQFKIGIIRNNIDEKTSIDIVPTISKRRLNPLLKFTSDKFILKGE